jgi:hypothetical protein
MEIELGAAEQAGRAVGRQLLIVKASGEQDFNEAFATMVRAGAGALMVRGGGTFVAHRRQPFVDGDRVEKISGTGSEWIPQLKV